MDIQRRHVVFYLSRSKGKEITLLGKRTIIQNKRRNRVNVDFIKNNNYSLWPNGKAFAYDHSGCIAKDSRFDPWQGSNYFFYCHNHL